MSSRPSGKLVTDYWRLITPLSLQNDNSDTRRYTVGTIRYDSSELGRTRQHWAGLDRRKSHKCMKEKRLLFWGVTMKRARGFRRDKHRQKASSWPVQSWSSRRRRLPARATQRSAAASQSSISGFLLPRFDSRFATRDCCDRRVAREVQIVAINRFLLRP